MPYVYVADIILEAKTALSVGSGEYDAQQDMPIQRDWNGLPIIMGTSLAGVLKSVYGENDEEKNKLFGYQLDKNSENSENGDEKEEAEGAASQLIVSSALLMHRDQNGNDRVIEHLEENIPEFMQHYMRLPLRNHTAIDHRGVAVDRSKHDKEIVYKGSRFKLRLKMHSDKGEGDRSKFESILKLFYSPNFRIGSKTTGGLGNMKPLGNEIKYKCFDITSYDYYQLSSSLNQNWDIFEDIQAYNHEISETHQFTNKSLTLKPENFFIFGSGFGRNYADDEVSIDHIAVRENVVDYENQRLKSMLLIPASSIKGSLSHRSAYHYNKSQEYFADTDNLSNNFSNYVGEKNAAVRAIFGAKSKLDSDGKETGHKGNIYIDDCYIEEKDNAKVFDHIAIDDFTSAPIGGVLFNEETVHTGSIEIPIFINNNIDDDFISAFDEAIEDLKRGWLPLGGLASRGHGVFVEDKEEISNV